MNDPQDETIAQLRVGMERRTTIGVALGILMERNAITHDAAFTRLQQVSSTLERKLYDVAAELVATGQLPEHDGDPALAPDVHSMASGRGQAHTQPLC